MVIKGGSGTLGNFGPAPDPEWVSVGGLQHHMGHGSPPGSAQQTIIYGSKPRKDSDPDPTMLQGLIGTGHVSAAGEPVAMVIPSISGEPTASLLPSDRTTEKNLSCTNTRTELLIGPEDVLSCLGLRLY